MAAANGFSLSKFSEAARQRELRADAEVEIAPLDNLEEAADDSQQQLLFVNEWLTAIADAVVGLFLCRILEIEQLSALGAAQLIVDLDYLRYVKLV